MKRLTSLIVTSVIAFIASGHDAVAFDPAHYQAVKGGKKGCLFCDLSAANLTKVDLAGVDLGGADLTDANLTSANLTKANLTGADLTRATLTKAVLRDADFSGVELDEVDLTDVDLTAVKNLDTCLCDWGTKLPAGWVCSGVTIQRE